MRSQFIERLIKTAGTKQQAANELRWMQQSIINGVIGPSKLNIEQAVLKRSKGYPLQYILGTQPFGGLEIQCRPGALIPRWETEEWTSKLAAQIKGSEASKSRVLDLCTGTGCILFNLLHKHPQLTGTGLDISAEALKVFKLNYDQFPSLNSRCSYAIHDVHKPLPSNLRECTLITSNPPYIKAIQEADSDVAEHEPRIALLESQGIYEQLVLRTLETQATKAVFEVGSFDQIQQCIHLFKQHGWNAHGEKDSAGLWRTVWATKN